MSKLSSLEAFLVEASKATSNQECTVSKRLGEHKFILRPLTLGEYDAVRKRAINPNMSAAERADSIELNRQLVIESCVEPNFRSEALLDALCVKTPSAAIDKVLMAGEVINIANKVMEISGFGDNMDKARKDAKN